MSRKSTSMKHEANRGEYVLLVRFSNMSPDERLKVMYSFPYRDKKGISIEMFKKYLSDKMVEFAYIKYTSDHRIGKGKDAALHIYRKWPNGSYQWLTKEQADYLMIGVDQYKRQTK